MNKIIWLLTISVFSLFMDACGDKANTEKKLASADNQVVEKTLVEKKVVETEDYESTGNAFWKALSSAELSEVGKFYTEEVLLLKGSEFLKKDWGVNPNEDRSEDLLLKKEALLDVYQKFVMEKVGKDKWVKVCSETTADKISFFSKASSEFKHEKIENKDVIMIVPLRKDFLLFVLRLVGEDIKIVMECTDY